MGLIKCLKKLKLDEHEIAILKSDTQDLTLDGLQAKEAAIQAIQDRITEYQQERESIVSQLETQGVDTSGIQVEEITDETQIQAILEKYDRRIEPQKGERERRGESKARELYESMSREELISQILKHELTGIKGRKAFVVDVQDAKSITSVDADSLKWINDNLSPDHGDALLQAVADALEAETDRAYHISGDEFYVLADTNEESQQIIERANERLSKAVITATKPDGTQITLNGLNITHGIGETKNEADTILKSEKISKQERGERAPRGQQPLGSVIRPAEGIEIDGKPAEVKEFFQPVYHGTPHQFDKFSLEAVGTGEGAQAYGWGLYFASEKGVAEWYRDTLSAGIMTKLPDGTMRVPEEYFFRGKPILELYDEATNKQEYYKAEIFERILLHSTPNQLKNYFSADEYGKDSDAYKFAHSIKEPDITGKIDDEFVDLEFDLGNIYQVDIPSDETLLDWDKAINEQPEAIKDALNTIREQIKKSFPEYAFKDDITGHGLYQMYREHRGGASQFASEGFNDAGIKGIKYLDGTSRGTDGDKYNYVIWDENAVTIEAVNDELIAAKELFQQKRGSIQFGDQKTVINLFKSKNLSTFLHESGHLFLDVMQDISSRSDATPELSAEWTKIEKFLGVEAGQTLTTEHHEKWATSFEAYLREGKAPSAELRGAFQTFRRWLLDVYKSVKKLLGDDALTNDIRGIFDRMLATDEQLQAASSDGYNAVFESAEDMGFTDREFSEYKAVEKEVHERAQEDLDVEAIKEALREKKEEWKTAKARVQTEVELEVNQRKDIRAKHFLMTGEFLAGDPMGEIITEPVKIDKEQLNELYKNRKSELRRLPVGKSQITAVEGGLHPDIVAEMLGYKSGDSLIKAVLDAGSRKKIITEEVDARMSEEYGDMRQDLDRVSEMAVDALHSDKRAHFLMLELKALNKRTGGGKTQASVLKDVAYRVIDETGVPEAARVERFLADERKNGRKAEQAIIDQDFNAARDAKRQQILSHYLYMAARDAKAEQAKFLRFFKKFDSKGVRKTLKGEHLDQIDQLLEKYDFKKVSLKAVDERQSLRLWVESQKDNGLIPNVSDAILDDVTRTNYKELTMSEFRGLNDAVKSIETIARSENKVKVAQELFDYEQVVQELIDAAYETNKVGPAPPFDKGIEGPARQAGSLVKSFDSTLLKTEQMIAWLDGDKPDGPWHKYLFRILADAEHARNDLDVIYTTKLIEALETLPKEQAKRFHDKVYVESLGMDMTYAGLVSMALNMGTESNFFKLVEGSKQLETGGFSAEQATIAVNKHLTEADWKFVDTIWKILDGEGEIKSLFNMLNEVEKEITGTPVKKVKARKVVTPFGALDGGYYPIVYSPTESKVSLRKAEDIGEEIGGRPSTKSGSVNERIETFSAPLDLDLHAIPLHISEITQDVTHRRAVMDAWKIVTDQRVRRAIQKTLGKEYEPQFQKWVAHVANDKMTDQTGVGAWMRLIRAARLNTSIVAMGFKWTTVVQQPLGITQSIDTFRTMKGGKMYLTKEAANFAKHPLNMKEMVFEKSGEMRHRMSNLDRDLRENLRKRLGRKDAHAEMVRYAFMGIGLSDMAVSLPTWTAAYKWAIDNKYTEAQAVEWADSRVRLSQGSGSAKDLSAVQRGHEAMKLLTVFYSYFNAYYQRIRDSGRMTESIKDVPDLLLRHWYITVIPAIFSELMSGRGPDEDEEVEDWAARQIIAYPFMTVPFVRDVASAVESGYGYDWTPAGGVGEHTVRLFNKSDDFLEGDADFSDVLGQAVKTSGYFLGLPTGQATITFNHMMDAIEGDSDFNPYYLLVREPKQ